MSRIPKSDHAISPQHVNPAAIRVVKRLRDSGFEAYIVGGAVRDLILGGQPKDFDVATNAKPEEIKGLFRRSRIIGRRFQIVHVRDGREVIEVTTYRGPHDSEDSLKNASKRSDKGLLLRDNVYGTLEQDAARRDLTINALYYDPLDETVLDQIDGGRDISARLIRVIGDPVKRYQEDPVRMLRVVRFAAKLQFDIEADTEAGIGQCAALLAEIPSARLFDEFLKLFMAGYGKPTLLLLLEHGLLHCLCPEAASLIANEPQYRTLVTSAMANTDQRVKDDRPVTPAFLLAALLWPSLQARGNALAQQGEPPLQAMHSAGQQVIAETCLHMAIPRRFSFPVREIWELQPRLERKQTKKIKDLLAHRRFRAAYDLLLLRAESGEPLEGIGEFWDQQQQKHPELVGSAPPRPDDRPPRRRRPRRNRNP